MQTRAAPFALDWPLPGPRPASPAPLLIGDIASARGGVPELLIQIARTQDGRDPDPQL